MSEGIKNVTAEIIAVGNELLLGIVQDTNTHWLCKQISGLGGRVRRCAIVADDLAMIGQALKQALASGRDLIIITGGLGPTQDDMTLEAVAQALRKPLEEHPQALEMVAGRYLELYEQGRVESPELTASRRKMARLPQGATPLPNRVGTAPGVLLREGKSMIVALPGVPSEMQDIFGNALRPYLRELFGKAFYSEVTLIVELNDESRIAPLLGEFQRSRPEVYIKSRPRSFEGGMKIAITLAMSGERVVVEDTLDRLVEDLRARLEREGFSTSVEAGGR